MAAYYIYEYLSSVTPSECHYSPDPLGNGLLGDNGKGLDVTSSMQVPA